MHNYKTFPMKECHLEDIITLDAGCFSRKNGRTPGNLYYLYEHFPEGCFIATIGHKLVGYMFCHKFGKVGYLGPLGVQFEHRNNGIAQSYIRKGITMLQHAGCDVIGLETLPEWGKNLGLYCKNNFVFTYPTIQGFFEKEIDGSEKNILDGNSIDNQQLAVYNSAFSLHSHGYSFIQDIEHTVANHPERICFYCRDGQILGFLAFDNDVYPFLWGSIFPGFQDRIFCDLYSAIHKRTDLKKITIRMNAKYTILSNLLSLGFQIERSNVRMLLRGYERDFLHMANDDSVVFRSWVS